MNMMDSNERNGDECDSDSPIQQCCAIDDLQDDMIARIFTFLPAEDMCRNATLVSPKWHRLANDPDSLCLRDKAAWERQLEFLLKPAAVLRNVRIKNSSESVGELWSCHYAELMNGKSSKRFQITSNILSFQEFVKTSLKIHADNYDNDFVPSEIVEISRCPNLRFMKMWETSRSLKCVNVIHLSYKLKTLGSITLLGCRRMTESVVLKMVKAQRENLRHVYLDGELLLDESMIALTTCPKLKTLCVVTPSLRTSGFTDDCLPHIKKMSSLRCLQINQWGCGCCQGPNFSTDGLRDLFVDSKLGSLTHLDLGSCIQLDGEGLRRIRDCCQNLIALSLTGCYKIEEAHVDGILNDLPLLSFLDLWNTHARNHPVLAHFKAIKKKNAGNLMATL